MFHPKEAAEDSHALSLAILFFAAFACLVSIYFHYDSGLKYWLLKEFGETTTATLLDVEQAPVTEAELKQLARQYPREALKNIALLKGATITVQFTTEAGDTLQTAFKTGQNFQIDELQDQMPVTYLPMNPSIAYPASFLQNFAFDGQVLLWSVLIGLIVALLAVRSARRWSRFRTRMRQY